MDNRAQDGDISRGGRFSTNRGGQAPESLRGRRFPTNRGGQARGNQRRGRRYPLAAGHPSNLHSPQAGAGTRGTFSNDSSGNNEFRVSRHSEHKPATSSAHCQEWHSSGREDTHSHAESLKEGHKSTESRGVNPKVSNLSVVSDSSYGEHPPLFSNLHHSEHKPATSSAHRQEWHSSGREDMHSHAESLKEGHKSTESRGVNPKVSNLSVVSDSSYGEHPPLFSNLHHSEHKPANSSAHRQAWHSSGREDTHSHAESLKGGHKSTESRGVNLKVSNLSVVSDSSYGEHPPLFSNLHHSEHKPATSSAHRQEWHSSGREDTHSHAESLKEGHKSTESRGVNPKVSNLSVVSDSSYGEHPPLFSYLSHSENLHTGVERMQIRETPSEMTEDSVTLPCKSEAHGVPFPINSPVNATNQGKPEPSEQWTFDLCPPKSRGSITLKASLLVQNRERRNEIKRSKEQNSGSVLQSGMVLLKSYLSLDDQMNIVKLCRDLGLGSGGFYKPGYRDGAKLNLMMMCLGKNWDPETSQYGDHRPVDGAIPPKIPDKFFQLIESAIKESQALIVKDSKTSNSEGVLPGMVPDICLVNFYSSSGRLGLHQDRDESEQSLRKCLPVVSFSIGDAAEFLYGEQRDVDRANKVILESGDVLIFGGKSRHVFHGVSSIKPDTAPKTLLEKTDLRSGRLNLTFREY